MAPSKRLLRPYFETGDDKFKMAAAKTGYACISASIQDSKEIPTASPVFTGSTNSMMLLEKIDVGTGSEKFKMATAKAGCTCISASIQDSKEIPTASPVFTGTRNSMALLVTLYLETGSQICKMAASNRNTYISSSIQLDRKEIPTVICMFGLRNSIMLSEKIDVETGSE
jgi:ABC-type uncharacterized transport system substrate-binding protein